MLSSAAFAQSILSTPDWIETQIPPVASLAVTVSDFQLATTHFLQEAIFFESESTLPATTTSTLQVATQNNHFPPLLEWNLDDFPMRQEPSVNLVPAKIITFESIAHLVKIDPQAALKDLANIRRLLQPEEALVLEIQIVYYSQQYGQAEVLCEGFLQTFPESSFFPLVYYFHQKSRASLDKFLDQDLVLHHQIFQKLPHEFQVDLLQIMGEDAAKKQDILAASRYFLQQREMATPSQQIDSEKILELLKTTDQVAILQTIEQEYSHLDFIKNELPYLRLNLLLEQFQYLPALALIQTLLVEPIVQEHPEQLEYLLGIQQRINVALYVNPRRIGVILPLSSTNPQIARLTRETLEGLRLGLLSSAQKDSLSEENGFPAMKELGPLELVLRDSQLNAEASVAAVRELVEEEHVIAIIGPLTRKTSEAAAQEAERLQVPLISLSLTASIPDIGSYIFRNNQSWEQEMKALARYAFDYKNARRFLILYPNAREGKNKMAFFWQEIVRLGGMIRGGEAFHSGQKDFVKQFEKFTGLDRYIPIEELKIMREFEEKPQPLHDFDALFIPIGMGNVEDLKVLLPYSEVYKINDIVFLGDSGWNNHSVVLAVQKYIKELVFVDSFFKQNPQPHIQRFVRLHERYFLRPLNYQGPTSYTAYAYDTVKLLRAAIVSLNKRNHQHLQQTLLQMEPYPGVTGVITFLANGEAHREMKFLTIAAGKIVSVN